MEKVVIEFSQAEIRMYLTVFSISELRALAKSGQLVTDIYDPSRPRGKEGYQRGINEARAEEISKFLRKRIAILPSLLPGSVILNCRDKRGIVAAGDGKLRISEDAVLHVVDGQHRIGSLKHLEDEIEYSLPATIIVGLNVAQEAGQFLTINSKQKRVRPDLQLRILYHQDRANTRKLIELIGVDNWKIEALTLCIALNDTNESPWRNLIRRPGDGNSDRWTTLTEANFVDSLNYICRGDHAMRDITMEEKEKFLIEYWEEIRALYAPAFVEKSARGQSGNDYLVAKGMGAGVFHCLAPLMYSLHEVTGEEISALLAGIGKQFPLEKWRRKRGEISKYGSSQASYKSVAELASTYVRKGLDYVDAKCLDRLHKKITVSSQLRTLDKAQSLLSPIQMRPFDQFKSDSLKSKGCYALYRVRKDGRIGVYVGRAGDISKRIKDHLSAKEIDLFAYRSCSSDREMENLEMALFHLVKEDIRDNTNHPAPADECPYCQVK